MNDRFEAADVEFVEHVNGHEGSATLDQAEFTEVQLLKLGVVDRDLLRRLRDQFDELDADGSGRVKKEALVLGHEKRIRRVNAAKKAEAQEQQV